MTSELPDNYRERLAAPGSALYYALRFAPPVQRAPLLVVHALCDEILGVPWTVSEAGVAQVKLEWWRSEIDRMFRGEGRHPLAQPLAGLITPYNLPRQPFETLIDGALMDVQYGSYPDGGGLATYLHHTGIPLAELELHICRPGDAPLATAAHHAGMGLRLTTLLRDLRPALEQGRCYLPESDLAAIGLSADNLRHHADHAGLAGVLDSQVEQAESLLRQAEEALPTPAPDTRFLRIRLRLARALLQEMRKAGLPMLEQGLALTPLRRLWLAWRTR